MVISQRLLLNHAFLNPNCPLCCILIGHSRHTWVVFNFDAFEELSTESKQCAK